jgi:hypothetical protein
LASGCGAVGDDAGSTGTSDPTVPAVDADSDLVAAVSEAIAGTSALATATGRAAPALRPLTRRLVALHEAHLEELGGTADADPGVVKGSREVARARLLRAEERLQRRLVEAALEAESGALAQVLASMAAAVAQQRAVAA